MRIALLAFVIALIVIIGSAVLLYYMFFGKGSKSRAMVKAKGRRAFDRAARLERSGGPETIDFRKRMWGHNIEAEFDSDLVAHGFFWCQERVYAGDYLLFLNKAHQELRYRFTFVQHTGNVDDMFRFEAVPTGDRIG